MFSPSPIGAPRQFSCEVSLLAASGAGFDFTFVVGDSERTMRAALHCCRPRKNSAMPPPTIPVVNRAPLHGFFLFRCCCGITIFIPPVYNRLFTTDDELIFQVLRRVDLELHTKHGDNLIQGFQDDVDVFILIHSFACYGCLLASSFLLVVGVRGIGARRSTLPTVALVFCQLTLFPLFTNTHVVA